MVPDPTIDVPTDQPTSDILRKTWRMVSFVSSKGNQTNILPGTQVMVEFIDSQVRGNAGCNDYFADFALDGEQISFSNAGITEKFCNSPDGVMVQEIEYLRALQSAVRYRIADGRLHMINAKGQTVVIFTH
jgi:heat shock protein HslJ